MSPELEQWSVSEPSRQTRNGPDYDLKLLRGFDPAAGYQNGFLSIGNFDGVHRGHQQMLACLVRHARKSGVPSAVLTFDPHPIQLLRPNERPPSLTSLDQKAELIEACGVDYLIVYATDLRLLNLSAEEFFSSVVQEDFKARGLVEGPNFFFGRDRAGTTGILKKLCGDAGISLDLVPPVFVGASMVSSSVIRQLLLDGDVGQANYLLGRRYRVTGRVSPGSERGAKIGFPTANLTHVVTVLPRDGVYAGIVYHGENRYAAAINLGPNPTFGEKRRKIEAHLLDFEGDLYDEPLDLEFVKRIRETIAFPDVEILKRQLQQDVEQTRGVVSTLLNR